MLAGAATMSDVSSRWIVAFWTLGVAFTGYATGYSTALSNVATATDLSKAEVAAAAGDDVVGILILGLLAATAAAAYRTAQVAASNPTAEVSHE